jgi:hypothetical protein
MERHDPPQPAEPRATLRLDQDGAGTRRRIIARAAAIDELTSNGRDAPIERQTANA